MALLISPANGTDHHHAQAGANTFAWTNTNPIVNNATHWRLKLGTTPFSWNKYLGNPIPVGTLSDSSMNKPAVSGVLYGTVEWSTTGSGGPWSNGGTYIWYNCMQ
jgi:hypothetical protein